MYEYEQICIWYYYDVILIAYLYSSYDYLWSGIAQSVRRHPTAWTARGSNPGRGEFFRISPER